MLRLEVISVAREKSAVTNLYLNIVIKQSANPLKAAMAISVLNFSPFLRLSFLLEVWQI